MFSHFGENLNVQNYQHFWGNILKISTSRLLKYPVDKKFQYNHSIYHSLRDSIKFVFLNFWQKLKMAAFFGDIFFIVRSRILRYPMGKKIQQHRSISHSK